MSTTADHGPRLQRAPSMPITALGRSVSVAIEPVVIFIKVRDRVKKVKFSGGSVYDLRQLFRNLFSLSTQDQRLPLYTTHEASKISFELENVQDLYNNCVVELKFSQEETHYDYMYDDYGFGYYAFQKQKMVFCMVGLPARGKSYIAKKVCRYLRWNNVSCQIFNVGAFRRQRLGGHQRHDFFDPSNEHGMRQRRHIAIAALDHMLNWLNQGGRVAIYDATNTTKERRNMVLKRCQMEDVQVVFIETVCSDPDIIEKWITDVKLAPPEYTGFSNPEDAEKDFRVRIEHYAEQYETIDRHVDAHLSWVKLVDGGKQVLVNNIESYVTSRVIHFLMNLHIVARPIWLTRHGQSEFNEEDRIGGDPPLTAHGERFAHALADWVDSNIKSSEGLTVWTSTLRRSIQTAQYINHPKVALRSLDEIDAGIFDGMTYTDIKEKYPEEHANRESNKLRYRYPGGESYYDIMTRLEPVIFELERQKQPILIVGHQAILRALHAYFLETPDLEDMPYIAFDKDTIYELLPHERGNRVRSFKLGGQ